MDAAPTAIGPSPAHPGSADIPMPAREYTMLDIAHSSSVTKRAVEKRALRESWCFREETGRGGRRKLFAFRHLPKEIQARLLASERGLAAEKAAKAPFTYDADALWTWAASRPEPLRRKGVERARVLRAMSDLMALGDTFGDAARAVSATEGIPAGTLKNWFYGGPGKPGAREYAKKDWEAALIPGWKGRQARKEIPVPAWDWFTGYYLNRRQPTVAESYRRLLEVARAQGWGEMPSCKTFERRLQREVPETTKTLLRRGEDQLALLFPPQRRDKRMLRAGQYVVGDGLKFDKLYIQWPDGEIIHTSTGWFWADAHSGMMLAWRLAKTENTDVFRLATYDLTGIVKPDVVVIDNTTVAANKAMTGGASGRHRFKDLEGDMQGILLQLGIEPQFTSPDKIFMSPGAKPIERAFGIGGLHSEVANHPRFLKRGFSAKTAIPYAEFAQVVQEEVTRFNQRPNRASAVCGGVLSFQAAFEKAFEKAAPTRLTDAQRGLLLLMPEQARANKRSGEIQLAAGKGPNGKPRYWSESLTQYKGMLLTVYYDPEDMQLPVSVYSTDGRYLCQAERMPDTAFNDAEAAREYNKQKRRFVKAEKKKATAQQRMDSLAVADLYPEAQSPADIPPPGVVRGNFQQVRRVVDGKVVGEGKKPPARESGLNVHEEVLTNMRERRRASAG
uniref:Mu transposase, C-terminal n=1 Tax=Candidatus Kentrum sp. UNK TaxID=2126344 RepID=A0A451AQQ5_9GAMM|nr:MAG: Mu transposase, C-terminal [Candidatus Kentron sp. UNK]VFK68332.1 MAG: Mu transposase, C-terminal [Candidatus Kentron sp. UNK]